MKSKRLAGIRNNAGRVHGEESRVNQLRGDLMLGDVIWVKINGCSWWPGQFVDENNVSDSLKPQNRVPGEVLVRLYGSYEYLYVDSTKCRDGFENILKQNNGSYSEIFRKALEQDLSCVKSARNLKKGGSKLRGKPRLEASKVEKLKQHGTRRNQEADSPSVTEGTPRKRTKVSAQGKKAVKIDGIAKNSRAEASVRVSPRRKQDIVTTQKRVKSGQLISAKAGEETSENDTPNQDLVQKKLKANSPNSARSSSRRQTAKARSSPTKQHANSKTPERVKSEEIVSRKTGEEASKNVAPKKKLVQKKIRADSARVSPRRQPDNSRTRRRVNSGELPSRKAREGASKYETPKQDIMKKNLKSNSQNSTRVSPRKQQDNSSTQKRVRSGEIISRKAGEEALENDAPKQVVQKKLKSNNPDSARGSPRRQQDNSRPQKRVKSGEPISRKASEGASENDTPKEDPAQKKLRPNSPNSVLSKSGKCQDLSERRTRVMQSLGLIAPHGSPFHRNGLALPSDVLATQ